MRNALILTAAAICLALPGTLMFGHVEAAEDPGYAGHTQCKTCHNKVPEGEQWNKWKAEKHAKAFESLKTPEADAIAKEKGLSKPAAESPECLKCHVTAYDAASSAAPAKIVLADGVQCETCHGPGVKHMDAGKKVLFQKDTTVDPKADLLAITEATCTKCHNTESPTWNPEKYTKADGSKVGFDFEQAKEKITHPNPKKAAGG